MVKKNKSKLGILVLLIGVFLLLANFNILGNPLEQGREARPSFDGRESEFNLELLDQAKEAVVGDLYWADVNVINNQDSPGQMFVQCSILDRDVETWVPSTQSFTLLSQYENCVADEPFTQTARVSLDANSNEKITFSMKVPDNVGGDNVLYCNTFEQCWAEGIDVMVSDDFVRDLTLFNKENSLFDTLITPEDDQCQTKQDCSQLFWAPQECRNGLCVDREDEPDSDMNIDLSDSAITSWVKENSILSWAIGLIIVLAGFIWAFSEPKKPQMDFRF